LIQLIFSTRLGILVTILLAVFAFTFTVRTILPQVPYLTALEYQILIALVVCFIAGLSSVIEYLASDDTSAELVKEIALILDIILIVADAITLIVKYFNYNVLRRKYDKDNKVWQKALNNLGGNLSDFPKSVLRGSRMSMITKLEEEASYTCTCCYPNSEEEARPTRYQYQDRDYCISNTIIVYEKGKIIARIHKKVTTIVMVDEKRRIIDKNSFIDEKSTIIAKIDEKGTIRDGKDTIIDEKRPIIDTKGTTIASIDEKGIITDENGKILNQTRYDELEDFPKKKKKKKKS